MRKAIIIITTFILVTVILSNIVVLNKRYNLTFNNLPDEFHNYKILQLSDLHDFDFVYNDIIEKIKNSNPDIVVLTGDLINAQTINNGGIETYNKIFSFIDKIDYPMYYIRGNHEQMLSPDKLFTLEEGLKERNVKVLDNESIQLTKENATINLYGLWFNLRYYNDLQSEYEKYTFESTSMTNILGTLKPEEFNILLTHNPVYFDTYSSFGFDLTLAGHMHGGMIYIPFKGGVFSPEKVYFPEYDGGLYEKNNKMMVVNRGIGSGSKGFRILNPPEITEIILMKR